MLLIGPAVDIEYVLGGMACASGEDVLAGEYGHDSLKSYQCHGQYKGRTSLQ